MRSAAKKSTPAPLTDREKAALVTLLADEDPQVYPAIRRRILANGGQDATWLHPLRLSSDPTVRARAQEILEVFARQEAHRRFLNYCERHRQDSDLEEGVWLIAQTQYPTINVEAYRALLDSFAGDLRERIGPRRGAADVLSAMNLYLFDELGFAGNVEAYFEPDNNYLNRVLDRRTGNPLTLCIVYWLLARRLRLPIVGIAMPVHFLCRYQSPTAAFFIDVFNRGRLLTRTDCIRHLQQQDLGFTERFLAPATARETLLRMCHTLHQIYAELRLPEETSRLQRYVHALSR